MNRKIRFAACVLLALSSFVSVAADGPAPKRVEETKIDRMTGLLIEMVPFGKMFDMMLNENPKWPMQDKSDAIDATQLACLRSELSSEGFRRNKRVEVAAYAVAHPSRIDKDIKLLEDGAAALMGKAMMAGVNSQRSGVEMKAEDAMGDATAEQFMAFMSFINAPENADLRALSGIGDALSAAKSENENEEDGRRAGANMATQVMLRAVGTCKVPMSALLK